MMLMQAGVSTRMFWNLDCEHTVSSRFGNLNLASERRLGLARPTLSSQHAEEGAWTGRAAGSAGHRPLGPSWLGRELGPGKAFSFRV